MKARRPLLKPVLWLTTGSVVTVIAVACTSSTLTTPISSAGCSAGDTVACVCADGTDGQGKCNDPTSCICDGIAPDAGNKTVKDAGGDEDGYAVCAKQGSFGWPCTVANANDTVNCTDVNFPFCFASDAGSWCTTACGADAGGFAACLVEAPPDGSAGDAMVDAAAVDAAVEAGALEAGAAGEAGAAEEAGAAVEAGALDATVADAGAVDATASDGAASDAGMSAKTGCVPTVCNTSGYCQ